MPTILLIEDDLATPPCDVARMTTARVTLVLSDSAYFDAVPVRCYVRERHKLQLSVGVSPDLLLTSQETKNRRLRQLSPSCPVAHGIPLRC